MLKGRVGVRGRWSTRGHIPHSQKWVWGWLHVFRKKLEKTEFLAWEPKFFNKQKVNVVAKTTCFDLQLSRSTRLMPSFCIFIAYINTEGILFNVKNYKMRLKQRRLNLINFMQVKKILFNNVFFPWSLCLLNMFPSMVFPKHLYFSGLFTGACSLYFLE